MNRPLAVTGKLSYSIYLNHVPILFFLIYPVKEAMSVEAYRQSAWLYLLPLVGMGLSIGAAFVSYRLIERPFLDMKRRLSP